MNFGKPYLLLLLLLLPLLAWLKGKRGRPAAFLYSSVALARGLEGLSRSRPGRILLAMRWFALAFFIVALAQPRFVQSETKITASGVDIAVAVDMSGSMMAEDFELKGQPVNRLAIAKDVLKKFIDKRPNDRIGLIVFSSQAFVASPLTLDHDFLQQNLDRLELGAIEASRTAIGAGLSAAVNRLRDLKSKSKIVILMTDGQNNAGTILPLTAADAAKSLGVKVYTIGVGTRGMARTPVGRHPFTGEKVYQMQPVDIDEETLKKIADETGGKYYRADNAEKFKAIYDEIDKLEKTEATVKKYAQYRELFMLAILPGLALLLVEVGLANTVWRRLP
jgi:Ca-activated chloride channel homolog